MHGAPRTATGPVVGDGPGASVESRGLDERDRRMLEFEGRPFGDEGVKAEAIRTEFGLSAARYYRILGALLEAPEALRHDPMLVNRLVRLRDARRDARRARTGRPLD